MRFSQHGRRMAGGEIVENDAVGPAAQELGDQMAADIAGPPGDQKSLAHPSVSPAGGGQSGK